MAKIKINGDSSGYVEIAAPNAAHNNTLELGPGTKILTDKNTHTGNIGIGTDNPTKKLQVFDSSATSTTARANTVARFLSNASNADCNIQLSNGVDHSAQIGIVGNGAEVYIAQDGVERLRINSSGNVGINTNAPTENLSVNGNVVFGHDQPAGNPGSTIGVTTVRGHHVNSDGDYAELYFANSKSSGGSTASIRAGREGDNAGTKLTFYTQQSGGSNGNGSERLLITSTGRVGIASDNPQKTLDIGGDVKIVENSPRLEFHDANSSSLSNVTGGFEGYDRSGNRAIFVGAGMGQGGNVLEFGTNNTLRLLIDSNGHLGINTVPSSWESGADTSVLQIDGASVACINDTDFFATSNAYWDGSNWKRIQTGEAVSYYQHNDDRKHVFRSSASGSPGSNVTWSNQLVIDIAGNLDITGIATATQFDATSDVALKENIEVIDEPISKLSELKGVTFDWKKGGHSIGVIAQDVEKVLPTAVGGSKDQKTVNYNAIIGLLVESVKDQQKQIEELKSLLDK